MPTWMLDEKKQKAVAFIGAGLVVVVGAVCTVYTHSDGAGRAKDKTVAQAPITVSPTISPQMNQNVIVTPPAPSNPSLELETTFDVCQGQQNLCPKGTQHVTCEANVADYIKAQCEQFHFNQTHDYAGGGCGARIYHVKCTARK
jgi:hypothetical protein